MRPLRARVSPPLASLWLLAASAAFAQSAFEIADPAKPPASRWQSELDGIDGQVRLALLVADDPRAHYVAGRLDWLDVESAVRHFTKARVSSPQEHLYLAALATACLRPVQPVLPECAAVDRLADWARRDTDNGLPQLWLAERARKRNDRESMLAYVEQAAAAARFDDYRTRGTLELWEYFRSQPRAFEAAARAEAALGYAGVEASGRVADAALRTCVDPAERTESLRAACARLGATMTERGASIQVRYSGASILERNAPDEAARANARERQAHVLALRGRCAELHPVAGLESPDAATRERALVAADAWVRTLAQHGEAAGCERLLAHKPR